MPQKEQEKELKIQSVCSEAADEMIKCVRVNTALYVELKEKFLKNEKLAAYEAIRKLLELRLPHDELLAAGKELWLHLVVYSGDLNDSQIDRLFRIYENVQGTIKNLVGK